MDTPPDIQKIFENLYKALVMTRDAGNEIMPMFHVRFGDQNQVIATPWGTQEEKEMAAAFVKNYCKDKKADLVAFAAETWMVIAHKDKVSVDEMKKIRASQHPDRKECLFITIETLRGSWIGKAIIEDEKVGELEITETSKSEGLLTGFLPYQEWN